MSDPRPPGPSGSDGGLRWTAALVEGVGIAFDALSANKLRSGLTILGVTIGVAVVMIMAAVIQGVNDSFTDVLSSQGPKTFYVQHARPAGNVSTGLEEEESEFMRNPPLEPEWAERIQELPQIESSMPVADLGQMAYRGRKGSHDAGISLLAVGSDYLQIDQGDVVHGRFFTRSEDRRGRPVAVVDSAVAADLFEGRDPLGDRFAIGRTGGSFSPFRPVGIYDPPQNLFAGLATHYVLVPFAAALKYISFWDRLMAFVVQPEEAVSLPEALDAVRGRMRQLRGLSPGQADDFALVTQDQILDLWNQLTAVLFTVMVALSSVGLMVGGVGVVGIMMISVTERTREIGLRKALGARRRDILWQFLVEASTLTLIGGAVGLGIGGGVVGALQAWTPVPASVPLWAVVAALIVSALTGIGFGLYPAARGARLDPVDALRYE